MNRRSVIGRFTLGVFCGFIIVFFAWFAILNMKGETIPYLREIFGYKLSFAIPRWIDVFITPAWPAVLASVLTWKRIRELDIVECHEIRTIKPALIVLALALALVMGGIGFNIYPASNLWQVIRLIIVFTAISLVLTEVIYFLIAQKEKSKLKGVLGAFSLNILSGFSFGIWAIFNYGAIVALLLSLVITIVLIILQNTLMKGFSFLTLLFTEIISDRRMAKAK